MTRNAPPRAGAGRPVSGCGLPATLALLMFLLAVPAPQPDAQHSQARIRRGILTLAPSIEVDRIGIETNVFNSADPQSDFVVALRPRLDASVPVRRRATLSTTFIGGVEHYRTFAGERSFNPNVRARVDVPLRRFAVAAGGNYLRTRQRYDYAVDVRARRTVSDVNGRVSVALSPKLALAADLVREQWRFDADARFDGTRLAETLDRDERTGTLTLSWRRTALSTFVLVAESRENRFLQSPGRNGGSLALLAGGEFHRRALISGSIYAGARRFTAIGPAVSDAASVVLRASLSYPVPREHHGDVRGRAGHRLRVPPRRRDLPDAALRFRRHAPAAAVVRPDRPGIAGRLRLSGRQWTPGPCVAGGGIGRLSAGSGDPHRVPGRLPRAKRGRPILGLRRYRGRSGPRLLR